MQQKTAGKLNIQKGSLNCDSEKLSFRIKCKVWGEPSHVRKPKMKVNRWLSEKGIKKTLQKLFEESYYLDGCADIVD